MSSYSLRQATTNARRLLTTKAGSTMSKMYSRYFKEQVIPSECSCGECMAVLCIYSYRGRSYSHVEPFCRRCGCATTQTDLSLRSNIPTSTYQPEKITIQTFVEADEKIEESQDDLILSLQRKLERM